MQEIWSQNYDPAGNVWVSALVALIPIIFFFLALTKLRLKGYVAGTITVAPSIVIARGSEGPAPPRRPLLPGSAGSATP
jgi:L-lactate permease